MAYEIDFLPVGEESKSGDAILVRYGDLTPGAEDQTVVLIDGGFAETAEDITDHLTEYYNTTHIDLMISTHPDDDHVRGLLALVEDGEASVGELWIHKPWEHSLQAAALRSAGVTLSKADNRLERTVANASALNDAAEARGVPVREPFTGCRSDDGAVVVVGPDRDYYDSLLPEFGQTTQAGLKAALRKAWSEFRRRVAESLWKETLTDEGTTSATNNTSVVTLLAVDGRYLLLTGDAGMPALQRATDVLPSSGVEAGKLRFVQVPHHGSRHNVGPTVLDRLLGDITENDRGAAFVSAAKEGRPRHPAKMVLNAFTRRGYATGVTEGNAIRHFNDAPPRAGWSPLTPEPLYEEVEVFD